MFTNEEIEIALVETVLKLKVEQLNSLIYVGDISALQALSDYRRFEIETHLAFSGEATANDVNICKN